MKKAAGSLPQFMEASTVFAILMLFSLNVFCQQTITFNDVKGKAGFNIEKSDVSGITVSFAVKEIFLTEVDINGEKMVEIGLPDIFLPNNEGAPNLPGTGRYIAIPNNSSASLEIIDYTSETIQNINVSPAPRIPKETENKLEYRKNPKIYGRDVLYPAQLVMLSDPSIVRGVNMVMLGFTPFQYNPVSKELTVYKNIKVRIKTEGGDNMIGDIRLRSRWFDPLLEDMLLNPEALPKVNYDNLISNPTDNLGCDYLVISPDSEVFTQWADTIRKFRTMQGINTLVKTLAEVGGNTTAAIESYINNIYNTWSPVPAAILLLGDYGTDANTTVISPIWNSYCASDNIYGDVNNDELPDIVMARITAQNAAQLEVMIKKFINYENNPPTSEGFYAHPVTALGWQTERWFQICSEVVGGFWKNSLAKDPVRVNAVYSGNPLTDAWSTATNTTTVVNYFGPSGLNYIPATPQALGGFSGGTPAMINTAINNGAFMVQHRDHGYEQGWGEPAYSSTSINGLTNTDLSFIMSVNCLTGKYNYSSEVFTEKFHRYTYNGANSGALGLIAASEVSYSFVNDAYIWGMYDNMWPSFMPSYGSNPSHRGILPAFGNAAGKYFLQQSSWPYNSGSKTVTDHLFHHHGDAFLTVYSQVPQLLTVVHDPIINTGVTTFTVTADAGALICLSLNGVILGTATGTGAPVVITIPGTQVPPDYIDIVVTLQNFYRYHSQILVIPPAGPYVVKNIVSFSDVTGNNNGQIDYNEFITLNISMRNVGIVAAQNCEVLLSCSSPYVNITDSWENYGTIAASSIVNVNEAFGFSISPMVPDGYLMNFTLTITSGSDIWTSYFSLTAHAPVLEYIGETIADPLGNNNNKLDPGENASLNVIVNNTGGSQATVVSGNISCSSPYITIITNNQSFGTINSGAGQTAAFSISADASAPVGQIATFTMNLTASNLQSWSSAFDVVIGQVPVLIIDLDGNNNSALEIQSSVQANNLSCDLLTEIPSDLNIYSSIFLCLGIYSDNHQLSSAEGDAFAAYLNSGGRLYMEGGDCWYYDDQTALQPMFNITGQSDGDGDLSVINGLTGSFTAGLSFSYSGDNNWIDNLDVTSGSSAFSIFDNQSPAYSTAIAFAGSTYKTIGVSHEFGGLVNGSEPSTRNELMWRYLEFFGLVNSSIMASFTSDDTLISPGDTVSFIDQSTGSVDSYNWSFPGGDPSSSSLINPEVVYANPGIYSVSLTVTNAYTSSTQTREGYIVVGTNSFAGKVYYDNIAKTPMSGITLNLKSGADIIATTTTDSQGNYSLNSIPIGTYTFSPICNKTWGGANGTDALLITKHFVGLGYLGGIRKEAADVDNSNYVNTIDALGVQRRFIQLVNSFASGDWAFENPSINVSVEPMPAIDIKAVCYGDVNASYTPAAKSEPAIVTDCQGEISIKPGQEFILDIEAEGDVYLGALSVFLNIPGCYEVINVQGPPDIDCQLEYSLINGLMGVSWFSTDEKAVSKVLRLTLKLKSGDPQSVSLSLVPYCEAADYEGNVYENFKISTPEISLLKDNDVSFMIIPNPANNNCRFSFSSPVNENCKISVFSIDGRLVNTIIPGNATTSFEWGLQTSSGNRLSPGIYTVRLESAGGNTSLKLIITR